MPENRIRRSIKLVTLVGLGIGLRVLQRPAPAVAGKPAEPGPQAGTAARRGRTTHGRGNAWAIAKRVAGDFSDHRIMTEAAGMTFYALLAIFPALTALISLYGLFADPAAIGRQLAGFAGLIPGGGMQILTDQIHRLTSTPQQALGVGALTGFMVSLWSANAGVKSVFGALNAVYGEREKRSFFHLTWLSLSVTAGMLCFVVFAVAAVVVLPAVLHLLALDSTAAFLLSALRWPLLLVAMGLVLAALYRFGPDRTRAKWRWISWGSGFAALTWIVASLGFSYYVANFGSYNRTYGSLGAAVGFMTWIWISAMIVLTGAELDAEMEGQVGGPAAGE